MNPKLQDFIVACVTAPAGSTCLWISRFTHSLTGDQTVTLNFLQENNLLAENKLTDQCYLKNKTVIRFEHTKATVPRGSTFDVLGGDYLPEHLIFLAPNGIAV